MRLYLGRHGEAGTARTDDERELTPRGIAETEAVYSLAAALIENPVTALISSPLIRAQQTSQIACEQCSIPPGAIEIQPLLRPECSVEALATYLDNLSDDVVMVIGHQPLLGKFLSWLCDDPGLQHRPGTSSLFALEVMLFGRGGGSLLWQRHCNG